MARQWTGRHKLAASALAVIAIIAAIFTKTTGLGTPVDTTNPLVGSPSAFCIEWDTTASGIGWTDTATAGIINVGTTFGGANGLSIFRTSSGNNCQWAARFFGPTGPDSNTGSFTNGSWPYGLCANASHSTAYCVNAGNYYWYIDGIQRNSGALGIGAYVFPNTMETMGLGGSTYAYGTANPITRLCIAPASGTASANPAVAIANSCGQFTAKSVLAPYLACYGCLNATPNANAIKVLALGDSITAFGGNVPRTYPAKLQKDLGVTYNVINAGVGGVGLVAMKATYDASYRTPAMGRCILLGGVNDIKGGTTGAVAYGYATAILDEMRADGCRPIVLLPTPWAGYSGWSAAAQTEYDTLRTSLSGYCTTNAATTTCIETRTALGNGATPALLAAAYNSGDGIHPNQTGEDVLEGLVFPAFP